MKKILAILIFSLIISCVAVMNNHNILGEKQTTPISTSELKGKWVATGLYFANGKKIRSVLDYDNSGRKYYLVFNDSLYRLDLITIKGNMRDSRMKNYKVRTAVGKWQFFPEKKEIHLNSMNNEFTSWTYDTKRTPVSTHLKKKRIPKSFRIHRIDSMNLIIRGGHGAYFTYMREVD